MSARPARLHDPAPPRSAPAQRALARRLLSDELPEALRPTEAHRRLQAALVWGEDELLDVRDLPTGAPLTIGPQNGSFQIFHDVPCRGPLMLLEPSADGSHALVLPHGVPVQVRVRGDELGAEELVTRGLAQPQDVPVRGARYTLGLHDWATYTFGGVRLVVRYTRPEAIAQRPLLKRIDASFASVLVILLLCTIALQRMLALADTAPFVTGDALTKGRIEYIQTLAQTIPRPVHLPPIPVKTPPAPKAPLPEGKIGKPDATRKQADRSKTSGPAVDTNKREKDQEIVRRTGLLALLGAGPATGSVLSAGGLGGGLNEALGGVGRGGPGDVAGVGGLGTRGGGIGGGNTMNVGGPFGPHNGVRGGHGIEIGGGIKHQTMVPMNKVALSPNCERDAIGSAIRRHWNEIRSCYEAELQKDPNLTGKVSVYFEIGPVGLVTVSSVQENTLGNDAASRCMLERVRSWKFPEPKGGGVCAVTYPFLFSTASR